MDQTVIREVRLSVQQIVLFGSSPEQVTKDVWIFSRFALAALCSFSYFHLCFIRPFARYGIFPMGGRSTAIRLSNGGVWVLASTELTEETKRKIDDLGTVE